MKYLCVFLFFASSSCMAQSTADSILLRVYYAFKHQQDTLKKDSIYQENMLLAISKDKSVYTSFDKITQAHLMETQRIEQTKNYTGSSMPTFKYTNTRTVSPIEIYQFQDNRTLYIKEFIVKNYLYKDTLPNIEWELTSETKEISKITCQKALATFKGRRWEAWFAPAIPFNTGPWLLNGLPGLILEAEDEKHQVMFRLSGIESLKTEATLPISKASMQFYDKIKFITLPKKVVVSTKEEINHIKQTMYKNPRGFLLAQLYANGGFVDDQSAQEKFNYHDTINNPIDLSKSQMRY